MTLALALGWKYDNAPGIETVNGVLTAWPEALGPAPDETEQAAIVAEYEDFIANPPPVERSPALFAQVRLLVVSDVVEAASTDGGIASSSVLDAGLLWCEFPAPVDGEYLVWPSNGATHRCYSLADEQFPEGFAVRSEAYEGGAGFPERLQILVTKS